jgi:hypothetical protein
MTAWKGEQFPACFESLIVAEETSRGHHRAKFKWRMPVPRNPRHHVRRFNFKTNAQDRARKSRAMMESRQARARRKSIGQYAVRPVSGRGSRRPGVISKIGHRCAACRRRGRPPTAGFNVMLCAVTDIAIVFPRFPALLLTHRWADILGHRCERRSRSYLRRERCGGSGNNRPLARRLRLFSRTV